jgi:hypothetical protein
MEGSFLLLLFPFDFIPTHIPLNQQVRFIHVLLASVWLKQNQNIYIMLTIELFLALLILCWVTYKSIDWFEQI